MCIPSLRKIAIKVKLVDKPNFRKLHQNQVPLIGGIAIAIVVLLVLLVSGQRMPMFLQFLPILASGAVLLLVGIIDDKTDLHAGYKLIVQLLLSWIIAFSGIRITSLYGVFGIGEITLVWQYVLSIIVITGVVNAFNLMDGVDGLVGGLSLLGFSLFFIDALMRQDYFLAKLSIVFMGAIIGFLKFNLSKNKIFMGDSGSLFLGFVLVSLGIKSLSQPMPYDSHSYGFLVLFAFFTIPVFDSIRVYASRIKKGYSPFRADRSHLHHLLLNAGLSHKKTALFVVLFSFVLAITALALQPLFKASIIIILLLLSFFILLKILHWINDLKFWIARIKSLEQ
jgi:UDP-GlcNAc:undecaprenyl-phosphate GlcNAc-1-phosphate transferase